jgi:hypothetical protein
MAQSKEINFKGQNVYAGIDVHLKQWSEAIITATKIRKSYE